MISLERIKRTSPLYIGVTILFYLPVLAILGKVLFNKQLYLELAEFIHSGLLWNTLSFSVREAFLSAAFSLLLALPGAYYFGNYDFPGKRFLRNLLVLPFMLPGILVVLGMIVFYGQNGTFNHWLAALFPESGFRFTGLYGFSGIVLANVFYNFSFCIRVLGESWERIDPSLREASASLGGSRLRTFWGVTLPLLAPTISYLFLLIFLYSFLSFTVVLTLGGYLYKTFEVLIYIEYNSKLNFDRATMIAVVQMLILAAVLYLQTWSSRRIRVTGRFSRLLPQLSWRKRPLICLSVLGCGLLAGLFFAAPLGAICFRSLMRRGLPGSGWTLDNYRSLFGSGFRFIIGKSLTAVIVTSIGLALTVAIITTVIAYCLARGRRAKPWQLGDLWLQLPVGISFVTFSFGVSLVARRFPPFILVLWAQVFLAFPLVYSLLRTAWRDLGEPVIEAARSLGANSRQVFWTVELPMMRKTITTAAAYAMAFSLGDLAAVLMLGQGKLTTVSMVIYRLIGHYHFPQALAMGVLFIGVSVFLYSLVQENSKGNKVSIQD
ncbi:MAG: iron ABC transporter permease [Firmicutes bacterium]|nr:iron ABC transporter permease [Bacillota bacterium]